MPLNPVVFVYGSLKRGFHNHRLLRESLPLGDAVTVKPYLMLSGMMFPYLIDPATLGPRLNLSDALGKVRGEAYMVTPDVMDALDDLEGHPDFYRREIVDIVVDGSTIGAWVYFLQADPAEMILPAIMPDSTGHVEWTQAHVTPFESHDELIEGEEAS